jgi:hypothetical protein
MTIRGTRDIPLYNLKAIIAGWVCVSRHRECAAMNVGAGVIIACAVPAITLVDLYQSNF